MSWAGADRLGHGRVVFPVNFLLQNLHDPVGAVEVLRGDVRAKPRSGANRRIGTNASRIPQTHQARLPSLAQSLAIIILVIILHSIATTRRGRDVDRHRRTDRGSSVLPDDPWPTFEWMQRDAPFWYYQPLDTFVLTRYDDIKAVAGLPHVFVSSRGLFLNDVKFQAQATSYGR